MKNKLRKIVVEGRTYTYLLRESYADGQCVTTLKIFSENDKSAPFILRFCTWDDSIAGNPLMTGIQLHNRVSGVTEVYNLNHPKHIRAWIIYGIQYGWTGKASLENNDALSVLHDMGYETGWLKP